LHKNCINLILNVEARSFNALRTSSSERNILSDDPGKGHLYIGSFHPLEETDLQDQSRRISQGPGHRDNVGV